MRFLVFITIITWLKTVSTAHIPALLADPSRDEFYTPSPGFEYATPGTILKIRPTPRAVRNLLFFHVPLKNSWQVLVRSQDSFGEPNAIVTTILEPMNSNPSKILSYQTFEDSTSLKCATSYNYQVGIPPFGNVATQFEMKFIIPALNKGYFVISPDYEGPRGAFTVGAQAAHAVLDSIRAVLNSGSITSIDPDAKVAMWGYSGGSLASSWAAVMQPEYAPELSNNLIGVALGGFVTNITAVAEYSDRTPLSGLVPVALNGLANEYPLVRQLLNQEISPKKNASFHRGVQKCFLPAIAYFRGRTILGRNNEKKAMFPNGWHLLDNPGFFEILDKNNLISYNAIPKIPIFVYHGTKDGVVPISYAHKIFDKWCDEGIESFEFAESLTTGHILETFTGAAAAWTWLQKRFDDVPPYNGCFHTRRLTNLKYTGASKSIIDYYDGLFKESFTVKNSTYLV